MHIETLLKLDSICAYNRKLLVSLLWPTPMNRTQILTQYRQRIQHSDRVKLTAQERSVLIGDFIAQLRHLDNPDAIEQLCRSEIALLEEGYGKNSNSTTNYLIRYRAAIAQATERGELPMTPSTTVRLIGYKPETGKPFETEQHLAWSFMHYDNTVYMANRRITHVSHHPHQDHPQAFIPDLLLEKAAQLLQYDDAESLAIGIATVTGRQHTEITVSGQFALTKHPYLLTFDGELKNGSPIAYTIATLLPAREVMQAIERFRSLPQVRELQSLSSDSPVVKNFRARVNSRVKLYFQKSHILPVLPGFQSVSIQRLQAAYARLVIYFWLPSQGANEQRFLQFYLGHLEVSMLLQGSNSATQNFDYQLIDGTGQLITASGIKLMVYPPLPHPSAAQLVQQQQANQQLNIELDPEANSPPPPQFDDDAADLDAEPPAPLPDISQSIQSIARELQQLPSKSTTQSVSSRKRGQPEQPEQPATATKPPARQLELVRLVHKSGPGPEVEPAPLPENQPPSSPVTQAPAPQIAASQQPVAKSRTKSLTVEINALTAAAHQLGLSLVETRGQGYQALLQQILHRVADSTPFPPPKQSRMTVEPAQLLDSSTLSGHLAALTQEIVALRQQIQTTQPEGSSGVLPETANLRTQLQQVLAERDALKQQLQKFATLRKQHELLQTEFQLTQNRLNQFLQLAQGETVKTPSPPAEAQVPVQTSSQPSTQKPSAQASAQRRSATSSAPKSSAPKSSRPYKLPPDERILIAINALIRYNQSCTRLRQRWFISINAIADMTGTNPATKVKPWLEAHPDIVHQIAQHHQHMDLTQSHHNRGKDKAELKSIYQAALTDE